MTLIKDCYNATFYNQFASNLKDVLPDLDESDFIKRVMSEAFHHMEYKERMRHTTLILHDFMPKNYSKASKTLISLCDRLERESFWGSKIAFMFLPDYVEIFGIGYFAESLTAFERITKFVSCEFAVRPFIIKYNAAMIKQMIKWSLHSDASVRRLASEGSRPRLPWAIALPTLKINPEPIFPILENLKDDPNESVRRSVANNLNDIAKDNPQVVVDFASKWLGKSTITDNLVKHACRTLLKQGHATILKIYGLHTEHLSNSNLAIANTDVGVGDSVAFSFDIMNQGSEIQKVRIEYAIYYMKGNGKQAPKVFKISERNIAAGELMTINRKHPFKKITTRRFYPGEHQVVIVLNGKEMLEASFTLHDEF